MSAISAIAIQDGQATPVTHTFNPIESGAHSLWRENQAGLALVGQGSITVDVLPDARTGLNRVKMMMSLPALEVITGQNSAGYTAAPKVGYENKVKIEFFLPSRGTAAQRKDLRVLLADLLGDAQVIDLVENLNTPY